MAMKLTTGKRIVSAIHRTRLARLGRRETWACQSGPTPLRNSSARVRMASPSRRKSGLEQPVRLRP